MLYFAAFFIFYDRLAKNLVFMSSDLDFLRLSLGQALILAEPDTLRRYFIEQENLAVL